MCCVFGQQTEAWCGRNACWNSVLSGCMHSDGMQVVLANGV